MMQAIPQPSALSGLIATPHAPLRDGVLGAFLVGWLAVLVAAMLLAGAAGGTLAALAGGLALAILHKSKGTRKPVSHVPSVSPLYVRLGLSINVLLGPLVLLLGGLVAAVFFPELGAAMMLLALVWWFELTWTKSFFRALAVELSGHEPSRPAPTGDLRASSGVALVAVVILFLAVNVVSQVI